MFLRRSRLILPIEINHFFISKRRFLFIPGYDISKITPENPRRRHYDFTEKLDPRAAVDKRPISLRFRVSSLIELSELNKAAQVSRLAHLKNDRVLDSENTMMRDEIIGAMCAAKRYNDAISLFNFFRRVPPFKTSAVSFNHIIKAHCDENLLDEALSLCSPFSKRFPVDVDTIRLLTKALVDSGRIFDALRFVKSRGEFWDSVVYSYLSRGFLDLGNHEKACELVDELNHNTMPDSHSRSAVVDATFVDYWLKQGEDEKAMEIYRSLIIVCAATGNTLLKILLDNGKQTEAWDLFNAMVTNSETFDRATFCTMVNACFNLGRFKEALETFKRPELARSSECYANIIAKFCDRGMMSEANDLYAEMCCHEHLCPEVRTFRYMINGYAKVGRVDDAIEMLKKMVDATLLKTAVNEAH